MCGHDGDCECETVRKSTCNCGFPSKLGDESAESATLAIERVVEWLYMSAGTVVVGVRGCVAMWLRGFVVVCLCDCVIVWLL